MVRRFVVVFVSGLGIALGITGLQFADQHEPTLANVLAGREIYSDTGTIRIVAVIVLVLSIAALLWELLHKRLRADLSG